MRDLGQMGEHTFSLWCADVGLVANGSRIDKTGWDFFVEFPFNNNCDSQEVHKAAIECKIQVKATDKKDRKIQITLSNLRRLITLRMPAFFVFIEFDSKDTAQRAFIVHVDNNLISNVLERLHKVEQSTDENKFNKRKMTINYDESNELEVLNGSCLKLKLESYVGDDLSMYIENKINHLQSTGFEDGFGLINFTINGKESVKQLLDASLGIKNKINISNFKGKHKRFGISNSGNFIDVEEGKIEILNVKPNASGKIIFKKEKLSIGLSFNCKLFISPFNNLLPSEMQKIRIEADFFELIFNPITGEANYSFSFGEGFQLELKKFKNALELLKLLSSVNTHLQTELVFDNLPSFQFKLGSSKRDFLFVQELFVLDCAVKLVSEFDITSNIDISLEEITQYGESIIQLYSMFAASADQFSTEFTIVESYGEEFDPTKKVACIYFVNTVIGSVFVGAIIVLTGFVKTQDNTLYKLSAKDIFFEKKIVLEKNITIDQNDIVAELDIIEKKYDTDYSTVTMYDKNS